MELDELRTISESLKNEVRRTIVGQEGALDLMMVSLLCKGHLLLEGVPGTGKTLLVRSFSKALSLNFGRIQFTPDLMPGDVLGTNLFNFQSNEFSLTKGPIFTDLLLADEINRTPPKTQSALLEAMSERSVTIDGTSHDLGPGFLVIATQNPIEQQGTYPLPEAQLDRFMFKYILTYPSRDEERAIVARHGHQTSMPVLDEFGIRSVTNLDKLEEMRKLVSSVKISSEIIDYIVEVVRRTREHPSLQFGGSPRAATMIAAASRAYAALQGRDYVIPDDVKFVAVPGLHHRVVLSPSAEIEGIRTTRVIEEILEQTAAPR
ncbi:AAA family ATPase [Kiloniella laminariae]|uniref:AAA family ATPase n=1 Tax=Kiloniella laminariae TaxID=454162 RepID=UPI00036533CF|nr:MoxR family ATPase [Kiloniella laminariae]